MTSKSKSEKSRPDKDFESGAGTAAVWAGETDAGFERATQTPIVQSVAFGYETMEKWLAVVNGEAQGHVYGRNSNPTVHAFEEKVRHLENAEAATSMATGMAAISNTFFALLSPGQRIVSQKDSYGGTSKLFLNHLPRFGVNVVLCETSDPSEFESEINKGCDLLYLETPTNPTLKVIDIGRLAGKAKDQDAIVVVDNTFATPINQSPLRLGADLVVHSATKFLGGHSDALGGIVCGKSDLVERIFQFREINGASLGPMAAYMLIRGLKTLELRVERQNSTALALADFLTRHEKIIDVFYPGLSTHPNHELATRQMSGFGGVFSFSIKGGEQALSMFLENLRFAHLAAHLGAVETIAGPPKTTSHCEMSAEERALLGIPENLIRYSVGIENVEDLKSDLSTALETI